MEPKHDSKKSGKRKIHKIPHATEAIGLKLKNKRIEQGYSLSDIVEMTGFAQSSVIDLENGSASNIHYYLEYAKTLEYNLSDLFQIDIGRGSLYKLSSKKQERAFLTRNTRKLYYDLSFFSKKRSVKDVIEGLKEIDALKVYDDDISSKVSSVLFNMVEEGLLIVTEKSGRNNLYRKK